MRGGRRGAGKGLGDGWGEERDIFVGRGEERGWGKGRETHIIPIPPLYTTHAITAVTTLGNKLDITPLLEVIP